MPLIFSCRPVTEEEDEEEEDEVLMPSESAALPSSSLVPDVVAVVSSSEDFDDSDLDSEFSDSKFRPSCIIIILYHIYLLYKSHATAMATLDLTVMTDTRTNQNSTYI